MLRLSSKITIGEYSFTNCVDVKIKSTWNQLTDTCTITIPRKVKWGEKDLAVGGDPAIKIGDKVKVELGYNQQLSTYYNGYVTNISVKTPVTIECQDAMWFLKQCSGSFTLGKGSTLDDIITEVKRVYNASDIKKKYGVTLKFNTLQKTEIGSFRADRVTMAFVFSSLKEKLGIVTFCRNNVFSVGWAYNADEGKEVQRIFNYNIISDNLENRKAEDIRIKIIVKSIDNKLLKSVEVGDADGDTRTYYVSGVTTQAQMKARGEAELPKFKYTGWFGGFETFGDVFIQHGDWIDLVDPVITDRNGKFFVKEVETDFGVKGFRNNVTLDKKNNS